MQVTTAEQATDHSAQWGQGLARAAGGLAALLASCALTFWVAANWPQISPQARLGLAQGGWALGVLLAAGLAWRGSCWAGLWAGFAALATGAVLALVGQIYQTGADRWQLFLLWAGLILPWLCLLHTVFLALLWALLLNLAGGLWAFGGGLAAWSWLDVSQSGPLWVLLGLNAGLLVLAEIFTRWLADTWHVIRRVVAVLLLVWAFALAFQASWVMDQASMGLGGVAGLLPVLALAAAYRYGRQDLAVVALALLAGIGIVGVLLLHDLDAIESILEVAVLMLALMLLAVRYLLRVLQQGKSDTLADAQAATSPWYLTLLRVGSLIPALILLAVWLVFSFDLDTAADVLVVAVALLLLGLGLVRWAAGRWWQDIGAILTVLGMLLCVVAALLLMGAGPERVWRLPVVLGAGVLAYGLVPQFAVRLLTACLVLFATLWLSGMPDAAFLASDGRAGSESAWLMVRLWAVLYLGAGLWAVSAPGAPGRTLSQSAVKTIFWRPLAWALLLAAGGLALLLGLSADTPWQAWPLVGQMALLLCSLLPGLLLAAWMVSIRPKLPGGLRMAVPLALCLAGLGCLMMPAVSVALAWLVLGRMTGARGLQGLALLLLLAGVFLYYQGPAGGLTLLAKSAVLAGTGLWLAGVACALHWTFGRQGQGGQAVPLGKGADAPSKAGILARYRPWGVLAGGVLVLGVVQAQVYRYDAILSHGRTVVLALVPVDPRSLMQGDYMVLDYAIRREVDDWLRRQDDPRVQARGRGCLLLQPDAQGVWQLQRVQRLSRASPMETGSVDADSGVSSVASCESAVDVGASQVALAVRWSDGVSDFGAGSWFFPEGQDSRYAAARYGVLRVADDGTALLADVLGQDQEAL